MSASAAVSGPSIIARDTDPTRTAVTAVLEVLTQDPRHSVRFALTA